MPDQETVDDAKQDFRETKSKLLETGELIRKGVGPKRASAANASAAFWDELYSSAEFSQEVPIAVVRAAVAHFGSVSGKTLLELGGGPGATSLHFGSLGANVINVEKSSKAIADLRIRVEKLGIENVKGICGDASDLAYLEPVDFVFGSMILHHLEPFREFVVQLRRVLKPGGKAFFYENNANSRLLVWFRKNIVGKLWIPKYGDTEEFPLTPDEVDELRKRFTLEVVYPEMLFFRLAGVYLLKRRFGSFFETLDEFFFRRRWLLSFSYRQYLLISG